MSEVKTKRDYFEQALVEKYPQLADHLKQNKNGRYCNAKVNSLYQGFVLALNCDARIDDIPTLGRYVIGHTLKRKDCTFGWSFSFKPVRHHFLNKARAEQARLAKTFPKSSFTLFKIVSVVDGEESPFKFPVIQKETPQEVADVNSVILSTTVLEQNSLVDKDGEEVPNFE